MKPRKPADVVSADHPATARTETPEKAKRNRGGAPKGNVNRATDKKFTVAMREAQELAKRGAQRRRRAHLDDGRRIVEEAGLGDSPLAERLAARFGDVEAEITELRRIVTRVGRTKRTGDLSPAFERYLQLQREDRAELRAIVDRLAELRAHDGAGEGGVFVAQIAEADTSAVCHECKQARLTFRSLPRSAVGLAHGDEQEHPPAASADRSAAIEPPREGLLSEYTAALPAPAPALDAHEPERSDPAPTIPDERFLRALEHGLRCGCSGCLSLRGWS